MKDIQPLFLHVSYKFSTMALWFLVILSFFPHFRRTSALFIHPRFDTSLYAVQYLYPSFTLRFNLLETNILSLSLSLSLYIYILSIRANLTRECRSNSCVRYIMHEKVNLRSQTKHKFFETFVVHLLNVCIFEKIFIDVNEYVVIILTLLI